MAIETKTSKTLPADAAISETLAHFRAASNAWFDGYWLENEPRVRRILADVNRIPNQRVLDIGCGNGYISMMLEACGHHVTATDGWRLPERDARFSEQGIEFFYSNLNESSPFSRPQEFDVVVMGEVIEHILNHPLGLMRCAAESLRPGGLLILTTPNPLTIMNAVRMVRGSYSLWGTEEFIREPKVKDGEISSAADIHWREYSQRELLGMISVAGLRVLRAEYVPFGGSANQSLPKRAIKSLLGGLLGRTRLFGSGHYIAAVR